jgi:glycosyltransferase involved in cell wall biosynthesis
MVSGPARKIHKRLEKKVLEKADEIITITPFYVNRFQQLSQRPVRLLTNGFDEEDFAGIVYKKNSRFLIRHIGIVNEKCDPKPFVDALRNELLENESLAQDLQLEFIGEVHPQFRRYVEDAEVVKNITLFSGNVAHKTLIKMYGSSSALLIILTGYKDAEGFLPGKLFEYLATGLPVLGVGPATGDAATLLKEAGAGVMLEGDDQAVIRKTIRELHKTWQAAQTPNTHRAGAAKFSRKEITRQLVEILSAGKGD